MFLPRRGVRAVLLSSGLVVIAITATACSMSVGSGIVGSLGAALLGAGLLFGASSQSGCESAEPCLSMVDAGSDAGFDAGTAHAPVPELPTRAEALDRMKDRLPADVVERLSESER